MAKRPGEPLRKRGRKTPPPGETARQKFIRLASNRMDTALNAIRVLGNLSDPRYAWMPEDLERMHAALMECIDQQFARFDKQAKAEPKPFRLVDNNS